MTSDSEQVVMSSDSEQEVMTSDSEQVVMSSDSEQEVMTSDSEQEVMSFTALRNFIQQAVKSPTKQDSMLEKLKEMEEKVPLIVHVAQWESIVPLMKEAFPMWESHEVVNMATTMLVKSSSLTPSKPGGSSSSSFLNMRERGYHALKSRIDPSLPEPLHDARADEIWPLKKWTTNLTPGKSMETMLEKLKFRNCIYKLQDKSSSESVCGKGSKPDLLLVLKGHGSATYSTGAIICLHSKGQKARFDNTKSIGEALQYGLHFLREAGPTREFVLVGITDLQEIIWFKVCPGPDGLDSCMNKESSYCSRTPTTTKVRQSLCAYLVADPATLGLKMDAKELSLIEGWKWKRLLGWGATSVVHEMEKNGVRFAVKVPRKGISLVEDVVFLTALKGIDGVPRFLGHVHEMLLLQPVGHPFSRENVKKFGLKKSLFQLVDILQAAHSLRLVNRDVRMENIMIAESLQVKDTKRFFILDWGFAAECGIRYPFSGCLYTTSNTVLSQLLQEDSVLYDGVDDLVALVRCMYMVFDEDIANKVRSISGLSISGLSSHKVRSISGLSSHKVRALISFWDGCMSSNTEWQEAECKAKDGDYDGVKSCLARAASYL